MVAQINHYQDPVENAEDSLSGGSQALLWIKSSDTQFSKAIFVNK